jgi:MFS family permease
MLSQSYWRAAILAPLHQRTFALLWTATFANNLGGMIQTVAASWVMLSIAHSPDRVVLVQAAATLPYFCFSLVAGALADTIDRRHIMLCAQSVSIAAAAGLAVLSALGGLSIWPLLGGTFLIGSGSAINAPTWETTVNDQVPREHIAAAVALNSLSFNTARSIGPAVGGAVLALGSPALAFSLNAFVACALFAALYSWRPSRIAHHLPRESLGSAVASGLRYVMLSPRLRSLMLRGCLFGFCGMSVLALLPLIARDVLGGGPLVYGILLASVGIGAMCGAVLSTRIRARFTADQLARGCPLLLGLAMVGIGFCATLWPTLLLLWLFGATWTLGFMIYNVTARMSPPRWVVGRTIALYQTITYAGIAAGSVVWGAVTHVLSLREALILSGLSMLALLVAPRWMRLVHPSLEDSEARHHEPATEPAVVPDARSGPIAVTIEYSVPTTRAVDFSATLHAVGQIRRRDGARRWSLAQDLDDPTHWLERFEYPTWLDHVRAVGRHTRADDRTLQRLAQLLGNRAGVRRLYILRPQGAEPIGTGGPRPRPDIHSAVHP